jgi:hypothetical protein
MTSIKSVPNVSDWQCDTYAVDGIWLGSTFRKYAKWLH